MARPSRALIAALCALLASSALAAAPRLTLSLADAAPGAKAAVATAVALSPDGAWLAAAGDDHRLRLWNAATGDRVATLRGHDDWVRELTFLKDGASIASVGDDRTLRVWALNFPATTPDEPVGLFRAEGALRGVAYNARDGRLATVGFGDGLREYTTSPTLALAGQKPCAASETNCVAFSPNGRWLAAAGGGGGVRMWDVDASAAPLDLPGDGRRARALAFAPDSATLAVAGDGPAVRLWRLEPVDPGISPTMPTAVVEPSLQEILIRPGKARALAFVGPATLAVGGTSDTIRLYDTESLSPVGELRGHTGTVAALAVSADGATLVSGSFDTTVRVWSLDPAERVASRVADGAR